MCGVRTYASLTHVDLEMSRWHTEHWFVYKKKFNNKELKAKGKKATGFTSNCLQSIKMWLYFFNYLRLKFFPLFILSKYDVTYGCIILRRNVLFSVKIWFILSGATKNPHLILSWIPIPEPKVRTYCTVWLQKPYRSRDQLPRSWVSPCCGFLRPPGWLTPNNSTVWKLLRRSCCSCCTRHDLQSDLSCTTCLLASLTRQFAWQNWQLNFEQRLPYNLQRHEKDLDETFFPTLNILSFITSYYIIFFFYLFSFDTHDTRLHSTPALHAKK